MPYTIKASGAVPVEVQVTQMFDSPGFSYRVLIGAGRVAVRPELGHPYVTKGDDGAWDADERGRLTLLLEGLGCGEDAAATVTAACRVADLVRKLTFETPQVRELRANAQRLWNEVAKTRITSLRHKRTEAFYEARRAWETAAIGHAESVMWRDALARPAPSVTP